MATRHDTTRHDTKVRNEIVATLRSVLLVEDDARARARLADVVAS